MKKVKEIPLKILAEYDQLENQHKTDICNYKWFVERENISGAKIMLGSIRKAEKRLEYLAETYSLPKIDEFNPSNQL